MKELLRKFLVICVFPVAMGEAIWDVIKMWPKDFRYSFKRHVRKWEHWYHYSYWAGDGEHPSDKIDKLHK